MHLSPRQVGSTSDNGEANRGGRRMCHSYFLLFLFVIIVIKMIELGGYEDPDQMIRVITCVLLLFSSSLVFTCGALRHGMHAYIILRRP